MKNCITRIAKKILGELRGTIVIKNDNEEIKAMTKEKQKIDIMH